jgi:multiple sugar transport system substrate-binding protein
VDKNRRLIIIGIATILIIVAIVGILVSRNSGSNTKTAENIELTYIGLWESSNTIQSLIDDYESEHPNVTITYIQDRITQYEDNIYGRLSDPEITPDIVRIHNTWTYKFEDLLSPLPPEIMTQTEYSETFYPTALDDFMGRDGEIYSIPLMIDGIALFYNKDLFSQAGISTPPEDWDSFKENAIELTDATSGGIITQAGAAIGCSSNINHSAELLSALMLQSNVSMTSSDETEAIFNTTKAASVISYYTDFVAVSNIWNCELRNDLEMFAAGNLAIMFAPSWRVFDIINMNPSINFGTSPLPQLVGNSEDINYATYWGEAVSAQSQHQLEAWQFVKFMSEKDQQQKMFSLASQERTFGEPYSRTDLYSEISSTPYVDSFILMAPTMISWKWGDETTAKDALNDAITDVVERGIREDQALDSAVETINLKLSTIYSSQ